MKDATGELSMTAVAVVAIAAISVLFSTLVWPTIKQNILRSTYCSASFDCDEEGNCSYCPSNDSSDGTVVITCDNPEDIYCPDNAN